MLDGVADILYGDRSIDRSSATPSERTTPGGSHVDEDAVAGSTRRLRGKHGFAPQTPGKTGGKGLPMKNVARGIGVFVLLLAALTACSSSSNKPTTSGTSPATATGGSTPSSSAATGVPVKLGAICTCSGAFASTVIDASDVFHAWVKSVNASGGIAGHPVDLTFLDDAGGPGSSVTDVQQLISDHVAAIADLSLFDSVWASAVSAAKIPVISLEQSDVFDTNPDYFSPIQTLRSQLYAQATLAKQAGATNVGLLYCAEAVVCAREVPALKTAAQQVGVNVVYNAAISATAPSYTAQCVAAHQANAQALIVATSGPPTLNVSNDCNRQGYAPIYVINDATYTDSMATAAIGKNAWVSFTNLPYLDNAAAVQAMNTAVDQYYPGIRSGHGGGLWTGSAPKAWVGGLLIRDAVKGSGVGASGTVTAAAFTQGLYSLKGDTLDGWSSPLTFAPGQPHPLDCWFTAKIVNGTSTVLNNAQPTCKK